MNAPDKFFEEGTLANMIVLCYELTEEKPKRRLHELISPDQWSIVNFVITITPSFPHPLLLCLSPWLVVIT